MLRDGSGSLETPWVIIWFTLAIEESESPREPRGPKVYSIKALKEVDLDFD